MALLFVCAAPGTAQIYWADFFTGSPGTTLGLGSFDGTVINPSLVTGANGPCGIAIDGDHVYWANFFGATIGRADKNGANANQAFLTTSKAPCGVAVNDQYIFWADTGNGAGTNVGRADIDGGNANDAFITGGTGPCGVALDSQYVYWANQKATTSTIGRAKLDGTDVNQAFIANAGNFACQVAVDDAHIYWATGFGNNTIGRADIGGGNPDINFITGIPNPYGVAVAGGFIYWNEFSTASIGRAYLDGTHIQSGFLHTGTASAGVAADLAGASAIPALSPLGMGLFAFALLAVAILALAHRRG